MSHLEVHAGMKVRPGEEARFRAQAAELMRLTAELDTRTLRYDWFINPDGTECEVHEAYTDEEGLLEHNEHIVEARNKMFRESAYDHRMSVYGEISPHLTELFKVHAGGVAKFEFLQGLQAEPAI